MRHGKVYRKFNRTAELRRAMFANMCAAYRKATNTSVESESHATS